MSNLFTKSTNVSPRVTPTSAFPKSTAKTFLVVIWYLCVCSLFRPTGVGKYIAYFIPSALMLEVLLTVGDTTLPPVREAFLSNCSKLSKVMLIGEPGTEGGVSGRCTLDGGPVRCGTAATGAFLFSMRIALKKGLSVSSRTEDFIRNDGLEYWCDGCP